MPLKIILISGFCNSKILSININKLVNLSLVLTNFFFSIFSLSNARTTLSPVRFSRVIKVILSIKFWNNLNFGITSDIIIIAVPTTAIAPIQIIHDMSGAVCTAIMIEIIKKSGDLSIIDKSIIVTICT